MTDTFDVVFTDHLIETISVDVVVQYIADSLVLVKSSDGQVYIPDHSLSTTSSVCFALYICGGAKSAEDFRNLILQIKDISSLRS